ncbi:MAG: signal recognition particle-docking protein FtsY [Oscillospiraceae bacterium]|jgi:fused signal recognition particle receptor
MGLFSKLKESLKKTGESISYAFSSEKLDDDFYESLTETLIMADTGVETAERLTEEMRKVVAKKHILDAGEARREFAAICADELRCPEPMDMSGSPAVIMLVGVNGAGKTTTAGKLAKRLSGEGRKVVIAAADTFRAAASEQLEIWGERSGCPVVTGTGDPSSVVYEACSTAVSKGFDTVICDTAGRLQSRKSLMDELSKMSRTVLKAAPQASVETLLVLDASTGQNAISQAENFTAASGVTGIVLTKLDGTAKGGSVLTIKDRLGLPVRYIGIGEQADDLEEFDPDSFAAALVGAEAPSDEA